MADLESLRLPEALWGEVVKACHRVPLEEETGLMLKLLETGMVTLLPEDQLPRSSTGDLMVGGLFCVAKNETEDPDSYWTGVPRTPLCPVWCGLIFQLVLASAGCC